MQLEIESPILTRKQAAKYLNISMATLDRQQEIPRVKLFGKTVMYEKSVLDKLIAECRVSGKSQNLKSNVINKKETATC